MASGLGVSNSWAVPSWFYSEHAFNLRNLSSLRARVYIVHVYDIGHLLNRYIDTPYC